MKKIPTVLSLMSIATGSFLVTDNVDAGQHARRVESMKKRPAKARFVRAQSLFDRKIKQTEKKRDQKRKKNGALKRRRMASKSPKTVFVEQNMSTSKHNLSIDGLKIRFKEQGFKIKEVDMETFRPIVLQPKTVLAVRLDAELSQKTLGRLKSIDSALVLESQKKTQEGGYVYFFKPRTPKTNQKDLSFKENLQTVYGSTIEIKVDRTVWNLDQLTKYFQAPR